MQRDEIGRRIRNLRQQRRLTQLALAQRSGVSRATIAKAEAGQVMPGFETLQLLADSLGTHVVFIIVPTRKKLKALLARHYKKTRTCAA
jgi:transcriptional regulator with XRE-family HTH domain